MTDQERRHVVDLLAAQEAFIHGCETLIIAHADLIEARQRSRPADRGN